MIVFPNCKINLGLNIVNKRIDGYHDLETIFFPIQINDILEILPSKTAGTSFTQTGLTVDGELSNNICIKAYQLLRNDFPTLPSIQMHLHKIIPMGAGLGGGSADGSFALQTMNEIFHLEISNEQLIQYALQLGSDCPFFIHNKPCFATSRGEIMEPVELDLKNYKIVLINPGIHISTAWAFSNVTPLKPEISVRNIIEQPIKTWKKELVNDFESPAMLAFPVIANIKQQLYNQGAVYASMTGSGSTLYGIFEKSVIPQFQLTDNCTTFEASL
jgi:4-diphosphocytidyl-2-C-methyl-D-erythritol kinase